MLITDLAAEWQRVATADNADSFLEKHGGKDKVLADPGPQAGLRTAGANPQRLPRPDAAGLQTLQEDAAVRSRASRPSWPGRSQNRSRLRACTISHVLAVSRRGTQLAAIPWAVGAGRGRRHRPAGRVGQRRQEHPLANQGPRPRQLVAGRLGRPHLPDQRRREGHESGRSSASTAATAGCSGRSRCRPSRRSRASAIRTASPPPRR